jgi:hypothetical protein
MPHLDELIPEKEFAAKIKRDPRTPQRWRQLGIGPDVTYIGRTPYYTPAAIERWLVAQERKQPRARRGSR